MTTVARSVPRTPSLQIGALLHAAGVWLLRILAGVGVFVLALPTILLFVVTAVPLYLAAALALADVGLIVAFARLRRTAVVTAGLVAGIVLVSVVGVWLSQVFAYTPVITGADGRPLPGSIATMEQVTLGGTKQYVTLRGRDVNAPVILFLAGGPGGSEIAHIRGQMPALEERFVVVNWDPANAGKSYGALPWEQLTLDRVVSDAHELTLQLRSRFDEPKIYLFGDSGGTIIGVRLIQRYPELYAAWIGIGQRTSVHEDDLMGYAFALEYARERGDTGTVATLEANGPPPYTNSWNNFWKNAQYIMVLNEYASRYTQTEDTGHDQLGDWLTAPEYGLLDRVNVFRGLWEGFNRLYPEHDDVDFATQATSLGVPVYFVQGRYDLLEMGPLLERWVAILDAPHKEIVYAEHSAHTPNGFEPSLVYDVIVNRALAQNPVR